MPEYCPLKKKKQNDKKQKTENLFWSHIYYERKKYKLPFLGAGVNVYQFSGTVLG